MSIDTPRPPDTTTANVSKNALGIINTNTSNFANVSLEVSSNESNDEFDVANAILAQNIQSFKSESTELTITDYIENDTLIVSDSLEKDSNFNNLTLTLMFDITGNDHEFNEPIEEINKISNIKNSILSDSFYSVIENQFKSVLKKVNGYKYVTERINEKVNNTEGTVSLFDDGISLRQETINSLSYIKNLNDSVIKNSENRRFKKITNFFIDSVVSDGVTQYENNISDLDAAFDIEDQRAKLKFITNNDDLSKFLMIDISEFEEILKPKNETSIIVQNFVNNARSIYTVMPNCIGNNSDVQENHVISYKDNVQEVFLNENINVDIWKNIQSEEKIDFKGLASIFLNDKNYRKERLTESILRSDIQQIQDFLSNQIQTNTETNTSLTVPAGNITLNLINNTDNISKLNPYLVNFKNNILKDKIYKLSENRSDVFSALELINILIDIESLEDAKKLFIYGMPLEFWRTITQTGFFAQSKFQTYTDAVADFHFESLSEDLNNLTLSKTQKNSLENKIKKSNFYSLSTTNKKEFIEEIILLIANANLQDFINRLIELSNRSDAVYFNFDEDTTFDQLFASGRDSFFNLSREGRGEPIGKNKIQRQGFSWYEKMPSLETGLKILVNILKDNFTNVIRNVYYKYNPLFYVNADNSTEDTFTYFDMHKEVSSNGDFLEIELKLKIDSLVKQLKLKNIQNNNVNFDFYKQIVKNIQNRKSNILSLMIPYRHEDKDHISVLNKNDDVYNAIFTKISDSEVQSNVSLSLKSKNLDGITYRSTLEESHNEEVSENISKFIENYYNKGFYFSSTTLLSEIIKDSKSYMDSFNNSTRKKEVIAEILYLNFFNRKINKSLKDDDKKEVAKRFLFKAIQKDKNSTESLKISKLKSYTYNKAVFDDFPANVEKESVNLEKDSENFVSNLRKIMRKKMLETYEEYKSSSSSLYNIERAIYNEKFLNEIRKEYSYSLLDPVGKSYFKIEHIFPLTHELEYNLIEDTDSETRTNSLFLNTKVFPKFFYNKDGKVYFKDYLLNRIVTGNILGFITTNDKRENDPFAEDSSDFEIEEKIGIYITDAFEDCIDNRQDSIFNKIIEKIKNLIRLCSNDYTEKTFNSENDILAFIENNSFILEKCVTLLEIYSEFFQDVFRKVIFDYNQEIFSTLYDPFSNESDSFIHKDKLLFKALDSKFSTILNTFNITRKDELTLFEQKEIEEKFSYSVSKSMIRFYEELLSNFKNENNLFSCDDNQENKLYYNSENSDVFCRKIHDTIYSLKKSDVYQALSFDLTREVLRTSLEIKNNLDKVKNKNLLTFIEKFNFDNDDFFKNIDNKYYQNMIKRNMNNVTSRNLLLKQNTIETIYAEDNSKSMEDSYNNLNVFDTFKKEYSYSKVNVNDDFVYAFDLPYEKIKNLSEDIVIKVTIQAKDTKNTNRMFYPIIRYFSPNLVSKNFNINSDANNLIYFTSDNNTSNINGTDFSESNPDMQSYLSDLVSSRLKPKTVQQRENFVDNIIESHNKSIELNKMLYVKHDINLHKDSYNKNEEMTRLVQSISDNFSKNIFGLNKSQLTNMNLLDDKFNSITLMNNSLNLLLSKERDSIEITRLNSYDYYLISIGKDDLIYNDITLTNKYNILSDAVFKGLDTYNRTSLYELTKYQSNEYKYRQFDTINVNEREFLTFIVKTEFIWKIYYSTNSKSMS